jgi:hypothetical protein
MAAAEDESMYNIIMPYTSFEMVSLTCLDTQNEDIILAVKHTIDDVEQV